MTRLSAIAVVCTASISIAACDKKDDKTSASAEKTAAAAQAATAPPAAATPASANASTFVVDASGKIAIDMPAPKEHIKATAQNTGGEISIDPANLAATKGAIKVDLSTLKTATFEDPEKNASQTGHALTWLEVGPNASPEDQAKNKFIVFDIKSVDNVSSKSLAAVTPTKDGADDVRTVTATVKGDVLLHGKKSQREAEVSVSFRGPAEKPTRVDIKSTKPFTIVLADHDVKPRDNFGKIASSAFHLLGTKVADVASINLELTAKPK